MQGSAKELARGRQGCRHTAAQSAIRKGDGLWHSYVISRSRVKKATVEYDIARKLSDKSTFRFTTES
jgi:hypothetical protein